MSRHAIVNVVFLVVLLTSIWLDGWLSIPIAWYIILVVIYSVITTYGCTTLSAQFFVKTKVKANGPSDSIAITFDDGPIPGKTEKVLDILKSHNVPATFFCIGNRVKEQPGLIKRIAEEGHIIGNHSYTHKNTFDLLPTGTVEKELADTNTAIRESTGLTPKFFRPPYGVTNPMIAKAVIKKNLTVVGWTVRSFDTMIKDEKKLFDRVTRLLKPGGIILFHDYCDVTIAILPDVIKHATKLGLKIVTVDTLLNEKAYE